ncbi:MAG: hypothetical protein JXB14_07425, partial [Candidatus Altiarchaeota archaeon]|nr:hypothetical protein [Candidatus Altiarchaeota archaeon]
DAESIKDRVAKERKSAVNTSRRARSMEHFARETRDAVSLRVADDPRNKDIPPRGRAKKLKDPFAAWD